MRRALSSLRYAALLFPLYGLFVTAQIGCGATTTDEVGLEDDSRARPDYGYDRGPDKYPLPPRQPPERECHWDVSAYKIVCTGG